MVGNAVPGDDARANDGVPLSGVRLADDGLCFGSTAILQLFEGIPVAISVTFGLRHRFVYTNARYRDALISGSVDPVGRDLAEVLGDVLPLRTYALRDQVMAETRVLQMLEEPIPPRSGAPLVYWDVTFFPLLDDKKAADGILTFAIDVSDRVKARKDAERRAEEERRRAEEALFDQTRLALAVDAASIGIWEWNVETGKTIWSDRQKAIWGLPPEHDASYEYWRDSIHPEDREAVLGRLAHTLDPTSGGEQRMEHRIVRPSGAVRWISSRGRMVYDEQSRRPLRLIGTVLDTTQRKKADEALRQILESREMLLREVNHRVKNSLQIVSSMLSLQGARLDDPGLRALIHEAQLRVHAIAAVHERLYRSHDFKSVDLDVFLEALCRDLGRTVAEEDAIAVAVTTEPVMVGNDRAVPIALILNELLTNAIKYAYPDRRGTIRVGLSKLDAGRGRLTVADDGIGLPEGFAGRRNASLGFRIIEGLARQIDGRIEIADRRPGTAVSISFDLPPG